MEYCASRGRELVAAFFALVETTRGNSDFDCLVLFLTEPLSRGFVRRELRDALPALFILARDAALEAANPVRPAHLFEIV